MLNVVCRCWSSIEWSTVSKAADKSNSIGAAESPRSTACSMSESTHRTAVSVEWPGRKPDCSDGRRSADDRFCISWRATRRSRILESTDKFDIGWYELTLVASKPAFFTMGVMNASLNTAGKQPSDMDLLNSSVMNGANKSPTCFNTDVGMGSAAECLSCSRRIQLVGRERHKSM